MNQQVSTLAWSWNANDGSALVSGNAPTTWGKQFLPYLARYAVVPSAPPSLQMPQISNGLFQAWVVATPGVACSVLASSNLTDWQTLLTTNSPAQQFLFSDALQAVPSRRFYRAASAP